MPAVDIDADNEHEAGEIARVLFHFDPVIRAAVAAQKEKDAKGVECHFDGSNGELLQTIAAAIRKEPE